MLDKYVFIQDDPFYLPKVLDKFLREFSDSTRGIAIQSVAQGKRSVIQTALELYRVYGWSYFASKLWRYVRYKLAAKVLNDWLGTLRQCYSVKAVARKYDVPVTVAVDVNSDDFRRRLRELNVELIVSISGTQFYGKALRDQTPRGIVNCHGSLLPIYRGLMPSFWMLANGEEEGGVSVHFVDDQLDSGPIVVQRKYRIHARDSLEDIMARSKDLAAEAIIDAVRLIEAGAPPQLHNDSSRASQYSLPTREDVRRFHAAGHRFY